MSADDDAQAMQPDEHVFYLNVTLKSAQQMLQKKLPKTPAGRGAAYAASKTFASPSAMATRMAPKMAEEIPGKLAQKGIKATAQALLIQGPFFVIKVCIVEISLEACIKKLGQKIPAANRIGGCFFKCLPSNMKILVQEQLLAGDVAKSMASALGPQMRAQTKEQGIDLDAEGLQPEALGPFLLKKLSTGSVVLLR